MLSRYVAYSCTRNYRFHIIILLLGEMKALNSLICADVPLRNYSLTLGEMQVIGQNTCLQYKSSGDVLAYFVSVSLYIITSSAVH